MDPWIILVIAIATTYMARASRSWIDLGGGCCHGSYMYWDSGPAAHLQACKDKCDAEGHCAGVSYGFNSGTWCNMYSGVSGAYTDAYCSTDTHSSLRCYKLSTATASTTVADPILTTTLADTTGTTTAIGIITTTSPARSTRTFLSTTQVAATTTRTSSSWTELGGGCCHGTYLDSDSGAATNLQACKDKCDAIENCVGVAYGFISAVWCNLYSTVSGAYTDANHCSTDTHTSLHCYTTSAAIPSTTVAGTGTTTTPSQHGPHGWKSALWTAYESWPRCCVGNPNYDPTANTDECTKFNGCRWAGYFAYQGCTGENSTGTPGQCTLDFVRNHNLVSFFSISGEHQQYRGKTIRIEAKGKSIEALVVDTCADSDCPWPPPGCCSTNAGKSADGFLIDMERHTVLKYWPEFTDPANQVFSTDIRWQPL